MLDPLNGLVSLEGHSYPENAARVYKPVLDWLTSYTYEEHGDVVFRCNLIYFNTNTAKILMIILEILERHVSNGYRAQVEWLYDEENDVAKASGEEFKSISSVPFAILQTTSDAGR